MVYYYQDDGFWESFPKPSNRRRNRRTMEESSTAPNRNHRHTTEESSTAPNRNHRRTMEKSPTAPNRNRRRARKESFTARKTVNVPIQTGGRSEQSPLPSPSPSRTAAALKLQKIFRGILVRRSMKKIIAINRGMCEIEKRIFGGETLELITKDKKKGLMIIDSLMALLLELDSVPGVNSSVRACRKSVANKVITLQEIVDIAVSARRKTLERTSAAEFGEFVRAPPNSRTEEEQGNDKTLSDDSEVVEVKEENKTTEELLKKIMADNLKIMSLLSKTEETQMKILNSLNSLTQRVQSVENSNGYLCHLLEKKENRG